MKNIHLLPIPKSIKETNEFFVCSKDCAIVLDKDLSTYQLEAVFDLADSIENTIGVRVSIVKSDLGVKKPLYIKLNETENKDAYSLNIKTDVIELIGESYSGIYYGIQTLLQIIKQSGRKLQTVEIKDSPDYPVRGIYFDISRGKVPTLEELYKMIDRLASYKLNQFHIYIEQTFAFRKHIDIWGGNDPITAEEIIKLEEYCKKRHVELVPSLSTFGHFAVPIKSRRKEHLNEMPVNASELEFSWWERVGGYTLDSMNPESIALIKEMIGELAPLFSSKIFNICCDETWDIGNGKNKELADKIGKGQLYCNFVKKIAEVVNEHGMVPMLWGDVILHHPELISELPENAIVLNYETKENKSPLFKEANINFYMSVQLETSNKLVPTLDAVSKNILKMVKQGKENGASGYIGNEWGDAGNINYHSEAFHGIILGGASSWNTESYSEKNVNEYDKAIAFLEFGDKTESLFSVLREMSKCHMITWHEMAFWVDHFIPQDWKNKETNAPDSLVGIPDPKELFDAYNKMKLIYEQLLDLKETSVLKDKLVYEELLHSARGISLFLEITLLLKKAAGLKTYADDFDYYETADKMRIYESDLQKLWHKRNRPSEFYRLKLALIKQATLLEKFAEK